MGRSSLGELSLAKPTDQARQNSTNLVLRAMNVITIRVPNPKSSDKVNCASRAWFACPSGWQKAVPENAPCQRCHVFVCFDSGPCYLAHPTWETCGLHRGRLKRASFRLNKQEKEATNANFHANRKYCHKKQKPSTAWRWGLVPIDTPFERAKTYTPPTKETAPHQQPIKNKHTHTNLIEMRSK